MQAVCNGRSVSVLEVKPNSVSDGKPWPYPGTYHLTKCCFAFQRHQTGWSLCAVSPDAMLHHCAEYNTLRTVFIFIMVSCQSSTFNCQ